jgi:hypothetical protein
LENLPEKFHIECKITSNPLDDLPVLNPNLLPFIPTDQYTLEQWDQLRKNHPGSFLWPGERPYTQLHASSRLKLCLEWGRAR